MKKKEESEFEIIQPATLEELDGGFPLVYGIYSSFFKKDFCIQDYRYEVEKALRDPGFFISLARDKSTRNVVGCVIFRKINYIFIGDGIWIHCLVVDENYRRKGIGTALFEHCRNKAREIGAVAIYFNGALPELGPSFSDNQNFILKIGSRAIGTFWQHDL